MNDNTSVDTSLTKYIKGIKGVSETAVFIYSSSKLSFSQRESQTHTYTHSLLCWSGKKEHEGDTKMSRHHNQ